MNILRDGFRTNSGGFKSPKVFLQEPIGWPSKIEQEIFDGFIERKGIEETSVSSATTIYSNEERQKYLTQTKRRTFFSSYDISLKIGNFSCIASYNRLIAKAITSENAARVSAVDKLFAAELKSSSFFCLQQLTLLLQQRTLL
jgi:hypothetical protein